MALDKDQIDDAIMKTAKVQEIQVGPSGSTLKRASMADQLLARQVARNEEEGSSAAPIFRGRRVYKQ